MAVQSLPIETTVNIGSFTQGAAGADPWPIVVTAGVPTAINNVYNVPASITPVQLIAANTERKTLTIYNDSSAILYVRFGTTVSVDMFNFKLAPQAYYESPFYPFAGEVWGVWTTANGKALISDQY